MRMMGSGSLFAEVCSWQFDKHTYACTCNCLYEHAQMGDMHVSAQVLCLYKRLWDVCFHDSIFAKSLYVCQRFYKWLFLCPRCQHSTDSDFTELYAIGLLLGRCRIMAMAVRFFVRLMRGYVQEYVYHFLCLKSLYEGVHLCMACTCAVPVWISDLCSLLCAGPHVHKYKEAYSHQL